MTELSPAAEALLYAVFDDCDPYLLFSPEKTVITATLRSVAEQLNDIANEMDRGPAIGSP